MIKPDLQGENLVNERSLKTKLLIHSWLTGKKYACSEKTELDQKVKAKAGLKMFNTIFPVLSHRVEALRIQGV